MTDEARMLTLGKGGQRFTFNYAPGGEHEIAEAIRRFAADDHCPLDWLDAARLTLQIAQSVAATAGKRHP